MPGGGSHARDALSAIRRLATSSVVWNSRSAFSSEVAAKCSSAAALREHTVLRGYASSGSAINTSDEFWVVEGEILRIKPNPNARLFKMAERIPSIENQNLTKRKKNHIRLQRVLASRLTQGERGQETYWKTYLERFQGVRDEWEKLYWDGVPEEKKPAQDVINKNDPFTILGLRRRERPYSPVELKSAYREMALKYHPDHNPGKDAEARFEKIWNAYKMLQHTRSWR